MLRTVKLVDTASCDMLDVEVPGPGASVAITVRDGGAKKGDPITIFVPRDDARAFARALLALLDHGA